MAFAWTSRRINVRDVVPAERCSPVDNPNCELTVATVPAGTAHFACGIGRRARTLRSKTLLSGAARKTSAACSNRQVQALMLIKTFTARDIASLQLEVNGWLEQKKPKAIQHTNLVLVLPLAKVPPHTPLFTARGDPAYRQFCVRAMRLELSLKSSVRIGAARCSQTGPIAPGRYITARCPRA